VRSGVTKDGVVHAVARRWLGHRALCGAGRIMVVLPKPFTKRDYGVCRECIRLAPGDD
jgi:hypothetical protein